MNLENIIINISNYPGTVAGEQAYELYDEFKRGVLYDEDIKKKFNEMKKRGIKDIPEAYADEVYNNPEFLEDIIGDKIYESGSTNEERIAILNELKKCRKFEAWNIAMSKLEESDWD